MLRWRMPVPRLLGLASCIAESKGVGWERHGRKKSCAVRSGRLTRLAKKCGCRRIVVAKNKGVRCDPYSLGDVPCDDETFASSST